MGKNYTELQNVIEKYGELMRTDWHFFMKSNYTMYQIETAIKTFANDVNIENVIALYDLTLRDTGKKGWLFTTAGIYIKEDLSKTIYIKYSNIESIEFTKIKKKDRDSEVVVKYKDGSSERIFSVAINKTPFVKMIKEIIELEKKGETSITDGYLVMEDMNAQVKKAYMSYVIEFANIDDELTAQELNNIYSLMVRIKVDTLLRQEIFSEINVKKDKSDLIFRMDKEIPLFSKRVTWISLIKDLIVVSGKNVDEMDDKQKKFLSETMKELNVSREQVGLIQESIDLERKYIRGEIDEKKFVKGMKDLSAHAAAIGFPIAAIYLSGSVIGLSAAGITSGLAAFGLGGVLGLSSLVTGVGVVVLMGVTAYKSVKWITSQGSNQKDQKREYLIIEAMKKNQDTITALIEDINYLAEALVEVTEKNALNEERIKKITKQLKLVSGAYKKSKEKNAMSEKYFRDEG